MLDGDSSPKALRTLLPIACQDIGDNRGASTELTGITLSSEIPGVSRCPEKNISEPQCSPIPDLGSLLNCVTLS